jgi:hypothetical protein
MLDDTKKPSPETVAETTPIEVEHPLWCQNGPECRRPVPGEILTHYGRPTIWQLDDEDAEFVIREVRLDDIDFDGRQTPGAAKVGVGLRDLGCESFADAYLRAEDVRMLIRCLTQKLHVATRCRMDIPMSADDAAAPPVVYERGTGAA